MGPLLLNYVAETMLVVGADIGMRETIVRGLVSLSDRDRGEVILEAARRSVTTINAPPAVPSLPFELPFTPDNRAERRRRRGRR